MSLKPFAGEEQPPAGFDVLISIEKAAELPEDKSRELRDMATLNKRDGLIKAVSQLHEMLGGTCDKHNLLRLFKVFIKKPDVPKLIVPFAMRCWIAKRDMTKLRGVRGIIVVSDDPEAKRMMGYVEARIVWPEGVTAESYPEIDGDAANSSPLRKELEGKGPKKPPASAPRSLGQRPDRSNRVPTIGRRGK